MSKLLEIFEFTAEQTRKLAAEQSVAEAPIVIGDVTVIPVSSLSCGFTCGGSDLTKRADGVFAGAGGKVKRTPMTFLAFCGGEVRLLQADVSAQNTGGLIAAITPLVEKLRSRFAAAKADEEPSEKDAGSSAAAL